MSNAQQVKGFGKGWVLIIYAFLCYLITTSIGSAMNIASGILESENGWNAAILTSLISLGSIGNVISGFVFGRLSVKYSSKKLSALCGILYIAAISVMGFATNLWLFGIFLVLANGISVAWGYQLSPVIIANWFPRRKGVILGIVTMGIPVGAGLASVFYNIGYQALGVRGGFIPFIVISILALITLTFLSDRPQDRGFYPDNDPSNNTPLSDKAERKDSSNSIWTTSKLLKTPQVWFYAITLGTHLIFASGLMVQIIPRLLELEYTFDTAIKMMLLCAALSCLGSYLCGLMDGKIGARKSASLTYVFGIIAIVLNLTGTNFGVIASFVFIGAVVGGAANWPASISVELWGADDFARGYGILQPMIQLIGAIGPAFFALLAMATGGYFYSYASGAVLMLVGLILFNLLTDPDFVKKEEAQYANIKKKEVVYTPAD